MRGIGPVFSLPATANPFLGTEKWSFGPTFVALKQSGPLTYGALGNHVWSFAGNQSRADVSQTLLQPFLSYTTKAAVTFGVNTETTVNWKAASGQKWTVPIIATISKVVRIGKRPSSIGVGAGYYVETPTGGPEWKLRTVITLLFPK